MPFEVAHTTKGIPMTQLDPNAYRQLLARAASVSNPGLSFWMEADDRLKMIQAYKKQSRDLGVQYVGPEY